MRRTSRSCSSAARRSAASSAQRTRSGERSPLLLTVSAVTVASRVVVADLARVDGALLRRHLRAGRARRRPRDRTRAGARPRDARRARLSLCGLLASRTTRRTRRGSPPESRPYLKTGDLIVSTHPEQVPVLRYYLGPGIAGRRRSARPARPADLRLARRGSRLKAAKEQPTIDELLATVPPREGHSSSSSRFSATIVRGARRGRSSSGARQRTGRGCCSTIRVSSWSPISGATRSRSRRTTSSRFRRLSTAESGSKGTIARTAPAAPPAMANDITQTTLVLGGGPAGLTAGYLLGKAGRDVVVLEAEDQVGGLAKTVESDGYRFDLGGHRFFTKAMEVDDAVARGARRRVPAAGRACRASTGTALPRLPAPRAGRDPEARAGRARRAAWPRTLRGRADAERRGRDARAVGDEPVRPAAVRAVLPALHREGLGRADQRDPRGVGGAAHQGAVVLLRREGGVLRQRAETRSRA